MVGELAARYVTVKYTDFYSTTKGIPHGVCVWRGEEGGGGCILESSFWIL